MEHRFEALDPEVKEYYGKEYTDTCKAFYTTDTKCPDFSVYRLNQLTLRIHLDACSEFSTVPSQFPSFTLKSRLQALIFFF